MIALRKMHKVAAVATGLLLACSPAFAVRNQQAADVLQASYQVRIAILWICAAIALAVFAVMIYSIVAFRKSRTDAPRVFDPNTVSEVLWAALAIMIVVGAVLPAIRETVIFDDAQRSGEEAIAQGVDYGTSRR